MASAIESTPLSADAPSSGDAAPAAWQLAALSRPARFTVGAPLSAAARLWLDWVLQVTTQAMERTLDRPVAVEIPEDPVPETGSTTPAFGIAFAHPACASEGLIVLDAPLARAVVDALETDFANLRGNGTLSDAESGLLEYAALACVDHVLRDGAAAAPRGFALRAFLDASELQDRLKDNTLTPGVIKFRIAGREGHVRLYLPGWEAAELAGVASLAPPAPATYDLATPITLRLALPPVALPPGEIARLQPGDLLLLGATELQNLVGCRMVTSTGWSVSSATILRHSPTVMTVLCEAFDPQVWDVGDGDQVVTPVLGGQAVRVGKLQRWRAGATLDLPKELENAVELYAGGQPIAAGELVRVDGEIGLRLLRLIAPGASIERR